MLNFLQIFRGAKHESGLFKETAAFILLMLDSEQLVVVKHNVHVWIFLKNRQGLFDSLRMIKIVSIQKGDITTPRVGDAQVTSHARIARIRPGIDPDAIVQLGEPLKYRWSAIS